MAYDMTGHVSASARVLRMADYGRAAASKGYPDDQDLTDYIQWFVDAEEATDTERSLAERDRDYYDNKQLSDAEVRELERRGQPPITINRIKRKIDFLRGVEQQQRTDPKAFPRNPADEESAHAATDALRFVADQNRYDSTRSQVWENLCIEGLGGCEVLAEQTASGEMKIVIRQIPWDRIFRDPHSREPDCSDANYLGLVMWMDWQDALDKWPDAQDDLDEILSQTSMGDTYDDRPGALTWCDSKRKRIRIVQMWHKKVSGWHWCTFTRGAVLEGGPSPYVNEDGVPECPLILTSAYIDRKNARYGVVREMIGPQDEINKRRSKALHLLTLRQVIAEKGAVDDARKARIELAKPDGYIEVAPNKRFEIQVTSDLAAGQFQLLQHATSEIDNLGPNPAMEGKSPASQSGRAIQAQQQGGYIELGPLLDRLRQFNISVYTAIWNRIRQFWTAEKWVRITDDERNVKFVPLNQPVTALEQYVEQLQKMGLPPEQVESQAQALQGDPRAQQIVEVRNNVSEMMVDIIVDDAPDSITIQHEQFELMVQLVQAGVPIPMDYLVELSQIRNKEAVLEKMRNPQGEQDPQAAQAAAEQEQKAQQLILEKASGEVMLLKAQAEKAQADAQAVMIKAQQPAAGQSSDPPPSQLDNQEQSAKIELLRAQTAKTMVEAHVHARPPLEDPAKTDLLKAQTHKTMVDAAVAARPPEPDPAREDLTRAQAEKTRADAKAALKPKPEAKK